MKYLIGVLYFLVLLAAALAKSDKPSLFKVRFLETAKCKNTDTVIKFENLQINRTGIDDYVLTGVADITKTTDGPLYMGARLQKCPEDENQPCVHFGDYKYNDLCEELKNKSSTAYDLLNNTLNIVNPKCPLEKHIYNIETDSVDMSQYEEVTNTAFRWKVELLFYYADLKTVNSCLYLHIKIEKKSKKERNRDSKKWQEKQEKEKEEKEKEANEAS